VHRGDLDPGDRLDAAGRGVFPHLDDGRGGVVIGDGDDLETTVRGEIDELARRPATVRRCCVEMEIDHRALTRVAVAGRAVRGVRP
jgi:hypothetical protein